jgi:endonuclease I
LQAKKNGLMKNISFFFLVFFITNILCGQIPNGYYDKAQGLSGATLKTALYNIIKGHTVQSYTPGVWNAFLTTDKKANGKVWDMYSDVPGGIPPYEWTFVTQQCGNYSGEGNCYNREHSFPQSWFNDATPMTTELFHIYPTDGFVNSKRSNYPFGEVTSPSWTSRNGSKLGSNSTAGYSGTVFEPINEYKGDFARTYFYMATRYEDVIKNWNSVVLDKSAFPVYVKWHLDLLIKWHEQDPVSQKELERNNAVYLIQKNRNPFIDYPEFVASIWGIQTGLDDSIITSEIRIFPNPAKDWIQIDGNLKLNSRVRLFNYLGQFVLEFDYQSNSDNSLDISHLTPGLYILQFQHTELGNQNLILIKQ